MTLRLLAVDKVEPLGLDLTIDERTDGSSTILSVRLSSLHLAPTLSLT